MRQETVSTMHGARDAEDRRLLDEKNHKQLLAGYFHVVRERCFLRLRKQDAADEAAQQVFERLLKELRAGRTYPVPYRIVVALVTDWTLRGFYPQPKEDALLPDELDTAAPDAYAEWEQGHDLGALFSDLPDRQREVLELRYLRGLSPEQIAGELGIKRNAVDQALHNGHRKLEEKLGA